MIEVDGFEWDDWNLDGCERHGVVRAEIEAMLLGCPRVGPAAPDASGLRIAVGSSANGRWLLVVFRLELAKDRRLLRPIAARYLHHAEVRALDQAADPDSGR